MPSKSKPERSPLVAELASSSEAFADASDGLQDAIVSLLERHAKGGQVTLYPARDAWIDGVGRETQTVPLDVAAGYLAHVPPPFYLDEASWRANGLLCEPPFSRERVHRAPAPQRAEPDIPDPFARDAPEPVVMVEPPTDDSTG